MKIRGVLAGLFLLAVAPLPAAEAPVSAPACTPGPSERCADDRLAAGIAQLLSPTELMFVVYGQHHYTQALRVAAHELAWSRVSARSSDVGLRAIAAQMLIDTYLKVGQEAQALELYDSLDAAMQERITTGPIVNGTYGEDDTLYVETSPQLTAAELAIALADAGRHAEVDELLRRAELPVDSGPKESWAGDLVGSSEIAGVCVRTLLNANADTDWFLWKFGDGSRSAIGSGCSRAAGSRAFDRRAADSLRRAGLPKQWVPVIELNDSARTTDSNQKHIDAALAELPAVRERIAELKIQLAAIDEADARYRGSEEYEYPGAVFDREAPAPTSELDRSLAQLMAARLQAPVYNPYRVEPATAAEPVANEPACAPRVLRCHEADDVRWELRISQDYDPTGEVPAAGFWLRRTELASATSRDLYLGIKEHNPFELAPQTIPLVHEGRLQLTVRRAKIDTSQITFPPLGLQFDKDETLLQLSASIEDILRDSDGDGLIDLAEQQLLLDPRDRDSDGDDVADAVDSLPHVATQCSADDPDLMAVAMAAVLGEPDLGISALVPESATHEERVRLADRTIFLEADPQQLAGICNQRRIVVLPRSLDMKLLRGHPSFTVFLPMRISLQMIDDNYAELEFSSGWAGGSLALQRHNGKWRAATLSRWVS